MAGLLHARLWRADVPIRPGEPRPDVLGRHWLDADRDYQCTELGDTVRPWNDYRRNRGEYRWYSRTIAAFVSGATVTVKLAFLFPVAPGDQFELLPGCDRTTATCANIFNNAVNFGGFPYIPTPETAV